MAQVIIPLDVPTLDDAMGLVDSLGEAADFSPQAFRHTETSCVVRSTIDAQAGGQPFDAQREIPSGDSQDPLHIDGRDVRVDSEWHFYL